MAKQRSPEARRLDLLLARESVDGLLDTLLGVTVGPSYSLGAQLTIVVDGLLMRGRLTASEDFAREADDRLIAGFRDASIVGLQDPTEESSVRAEILNLFQDGILSASLSLSRKRMAASSKQFQAHVSSLPEPPAEIDDIPDELVPAAIDEMAPHVVFTLGQAEVLLAPHGWQHVGTVRVITSHVAAWWVSSPSGGD